jgi:ketosteroid isomerase-like protein
MYRLIVAIRVKRTWRALQLGNADAVLVQLAERFEHRFAGEHALGGTRHTRESQTAWFERLFRLLPDIRFTVRDLLVTGWPWHTRAVTIIDVRLQSEPAYRNTVVQLIELRWGKITRIENLEDTQRLAQLLETRARQGTAEAVAAPISDDPRHDAHVPDRSQRRPAVRQPG